MRTLFLTLTVIKAKRGEGESNNASFKLNLKDINIFKNKKILYTHDTRMPSKWNIKKKVLKIKNEQLIQKFQQKG